MRINLFGQRNILGMGVLFGNFVDGLKKMPFTLPLISEIDVTDELAVNEAVKLSSQSDINVWFLPSPMYRRPYGKNIVWAFFESTILPSVYINYYNSAEQVWAPSRWAYDVLVNNGVNSKKIKVIHAGVCPATYNPFYRKIERKKYDSKFRFLAVGKYEERKGYTQLFDAFKRSFYNNSDVELIIKADCFANIEPKKQRLMATIKELNISNIKIADGEYKINDMVNLYNSCDCFVYPSRAEGWGLPLIEAIACGLPVMSTSYSGQQEFLSYINGYFMPLDYKMVQIEQEFKKLWLIEDAHNAVWAEADPIEMASKMRVMINSHVEWSEKAIVASNIIRSKFSWQNAVDSAIQAFLSI